VGVSAFESIPEEDEALGKNLINFKTPKLKDGIKRIVH